jgi:hypothetical protein
VQQRLDRGVEQRDDALLLVGEVLVERGLRHPRLAGDRLGGRVRIADTREHRRRRREKACALAILTHLQGWGMTPAGDSGTFLHRRRS